MGSKQAFIHLFHQMVNLEGIYELKQGCLVVPLVQDFPTKKELAHDAPDELLPIVCGLVGIHYL